MRVGGRWALGGHFFFLLARTHLPLGGSENTQLLRDVYHMQIVAVAGHVLCAFWGAGMSILLISVQSEDSRALIKWSKEVGPLLPIMLTVEPSS